MQYHEQVQQFDCGISVIQMFYKYFYNEWISHATLKSNVNYDKNGINILELTSLAKKFGMKLEAFEGTIDLLLKIDFKIPIITIIKNVNFFHYVVLEKINKKFVIYYDPILGKQKKSLTDFKKIYVNLVITCTKSTYTHNDIKENKLDLFKFDFIKESIFLSIVSVFIITFTFIGTFYFKIILDHVIPSYLKNELLIISIFFILISIIKIILGLLKNWFIHKIELKQNIIYLNLFLQKISDVKWIKVNNFDESMYLKNLEFANQIAIFKANYLFTSISQGFCLIFSTSILIWLDFNVFFVSLVCASILIIITILFQKRFKKIEKENITNSILFQKNFLNIIASVPDYKIGNIKNYLDKSLLSSLELNVNTQIQANKNELIFNLFTQIIKSMTPFLIVILSIYKIWNNNLTIGELLLFMAIFNFFIDPLSTFTSMLIDIPLTKQYLDNFNAFLILENENKNNYGYKIEKINSIKVEKLKFSFQEGKNILNISNLEINQKIHIIGKNGSGKSTLLKILSTLINVNNISFNDKLIDYYSLDNLRKQICYISNNEYIPYSTIYQFLTSNKKENIDILLSNIDKYNLLDLFAIMNLSLHQSIDEYGKNLSSGQKQFILIMKIFANNSSLILLDEAFENLDTEIIKNVFPVLRDKLKNEIVIEISHRKTFLFNAMEINCDQYK